MSVVIDGGSISTIFLCMVLVSLVHSIVLMRVCMHVIDRVYPVGQEKNQ